MTARERLFAALKGQKTDRTPIWLLFPYHTAGYYVDVRTNPCYVPIFEKSKECCLMLNRRNPRVPLFAQEVEMREERLEVDGWKVNRRTMSYGGRQLVAETRTRGDEVIQKKLLENEGDLDTLLTFPMSDAARVVAALEAFAAKYLQERAQFPERYGSMMLDQGEPISFLYHQSDLQEFTLWSLSCPEKVIAFLDRAMAVYREVYRHTLARRWAEVYFLVGSELASPPMVSRETFRKWIVPYAKELIGMIHAGGALAIQHYHGQIKFILEDFVEMGADGLHTIESPPTGNCTLTAAYDIVGDKITLIGNVQYDLFRSLTPAQMKEEVRSVLDEVNGRRFILSPSAGPYEPVISQQMMDNYMAFIEAGWEYRGGLR